MGHVPAFRRGTRRVMNTTGTSRVGTDGGHVRAAAGCVEDLLLDGLAERVAERVFAKLVDAQVAPTKRLLTMEQAGEYLGRSRESMQHLVSSGKLPTVRSDRRVFLDVKDLDEWIQANKVHGI
jgi:excisionase family DNA binding protein